MITGGSEMIEKLRAFKAAFPEKVAAAAEAEGRAILDVAISRCPEAPGGGALRNSGKLVGPEIDGSKIRMTLSFGDDETNAYAVAVHEHLSPASPPSWRKAEASGDGIHWTVSGTGPKFLESAVNDAEPEILGNLATRLKIE